MTTFEQALQSEPTATLLRFLGLQVAGSDGARHTLRLLREELGERQAATPLGLAQGLSILIETDLRSELSALRCPTHWLFGARDTLVPAGVRDCLARLLPTARIDTIDGAGHAPFLSHPVQCLDSLLAAAA